MQVRRYNVSVTFIPRTGNTAPVELNAIEAYDPREPEFDLKRTGSDLVEHEGIEWIELVCRYCQRKGRFQPLVTAANLVPDLGDGTTVKDFLTLAECPNCTCITFVASYEVDFDPDWHYGYQFHHPLAHADWNLFGTPRKVFSALDEAHKALKIGANNAVEVMVRTALDNLLIEQGIPLVGAEGYADLAKKSEMVLPESLGHEHEFEPYHSSARAAEAFVFLQALVQHFYPRIS